MEKKIKKDAIAFLRNDMSFLKVYSKEDWLSFLLCLNKNGLLTRHIKNLIPIAPPFIKKALKKSWASHIDEMERRVEALEAFASMARILDLRFAIIRGMSSSVRLYGNAFCRSSNDIDILIAPDDIAKADYVAREAGWIQPGEAFKIRGSLAKGAIELELLKNSSAPFSLRSNSFPTSYN